MLKANYSVLCRIKWVNICFKRCKKAFHDYYQLILAFKSLKCNGGSFLFRFANHTRFPFSRNIRSWTSAVVHTDVLYDKAKALVLKEQKQPLIILMTSFSNRDHLPKIIVDHEKLNLFITLPLDLVCLLLISVSLFHIPALMSISTNWCTNNLIYFLYAYNSTC